MSLGDCAARRRPYSPGSASHTMPSGGGSARFSRDLAPPAGRASPTTRCRGLRERRDAQLSLCEDHRPFCGLRARPLALLTFHPRGRHRNLGKRSKPSALQNRKTTLWTRRNVQPFRFSGQQSEAGLRPHPRIQRSAVTRLFCVTLPGDIVIYKVHA